MLRKDRSDGRDANLNETCALGLILASSIDRALAERYLYGESSIMIRRAPSGIYRLLAAAASRSPALFACCASQIEAALGELARGFEETPGSALNELIDNGSLILDRRERAALLWSLLRRNDPALGRALDRFEPLAATA